MQWDTKQKFNCPLLAHTHTHTHREKEQLRRPVSVRKDNRKILYLNRPGAPCFMPSYPFLFFFKRLVVFFFIPNQFETIPEKMDRRKSP